MIKILKNKAVIAVLSSVAILATLVTLLLSYTTKTYSQKLFNKPYTSVVSISPRGPVESIVIPELNPRGACLVATNNLKLFIKNNPASLGSPVGAELKTYLPIFNTVLKKCTPSQRIAIITDIVSPWLKEAAKITASRNM